MTSYRVRGFVNFGSGSDLFPTTQSHRAPVTPFNCGVSDLGSGVARFKLFFFDIA